MSKNCHFKLTYGGSNTDRNTCLATELYRWSSISDCYNNDWLYDSSNYQWTLTTVKDNDIKVIVIYNFGRINFTNAENTLITVSPAVYLSSNVIISGGDGSGSSPFTLTIG